jgi:hypothetical protein
MVHVTGFPLLHHIRIRSVVVGVVLFVLLLLPVSVVAP